MICEGLSEEEIYDALLIYTSLHGLCTDPQKLRQQVADFERCMPDEMIDHAIMAYIEDKIVAPPDVVVQRWGASRVYELDTSIAETVRHKVCESWFVNGCRFELDFKKAPVIAHFWTAFDVLDQARTGEQVLAAGTRLRFELDSNSCVRVTHRNFGYLGNLTPQLGVLLHSTCLKGRKYLPLVDKHSCPSGPCKILVTTAVQQMSVADIVAYSAVAYHAIRSKC